MAESVAARSAWTSLSPSRSGVPSPRENVFAEFGQRDIRRYMSDSVSAMSSATTKPSRASSMAGFRICASVNLPEPYFSSASANPATVPGTPMPSAELRDLSLIGLAVGPEKNIARRRRRRGLAIVDRDIFVALGGMDHHEAAAADIAGARIGHGQRKAGRDRGIDRIAALPQDVGADLRGEFLLRHHHAVFGGTARTVERSGGV